MIWDLETGTILRTMMGHLGDVTSLSYSPCGSIIASGSNDRTLILWTLHDSTNKVLRGHMRDVLSVDYSPDGNYLASGSLDHTVVVWGVNTGFVVQTLRGHTKAVNTVHYASHGRFLASGSSDRSISWPSDYVHVQYM